MSYWLRLILCWWIYLAFIRFFGGKVEILKIMEKIVKEEPIDLEAWSKKYEGIKSEWSFEELRMWISSMEENEKKEKLLKALNTFEEHDLKNME